MNVISYSRMLPVKLDGFDTSILKSLFQDGRKSFRQVSRETGMTTPTVKARFDRLVNIGFIKAVVPIIDFERFNKMKKFLNCELKAMTINTSKIKRNKIRYKKWLKDNDDL